MPWEEERETMDHQNKVHELFCVRRILIAQEKIPRKRDKSPVVSALQRTGQFMECAFVSLPGVVQGEGSLPVTHRMFPSTDCLHGYAQPKLK